jgi:hypothetical protein
VRRKKRPDDVIILVAVRVSATGDDVSSGSICLFVTGFMRPVHLLLKVDAHFLLRPATQSFATNIWVAENVFSCSEAQHSAAIVLLICCKYISMIFFPQQVYQICMNTCISTFKMHVKIIDILFGACLHVCLKHCRSFQSTLKFVKAFHMKILFNNIRHHIWFNRFQLEHNIFNLLFFSWHRCYFWAYDIFLWIWCQNKLRILTGKHNIVNTTEKRAYLRGSSRCKSNCTFFKFEYFTFQLTA